MTTNTRDKSAKAQILTESLPFMRQYSGHRLVVKFGGNAMVEADTLRNFAQDIVLLHQVGTCPVVVHGGGPQIGDMLKKLNIQSDFVNGLRITDRDTVSVVEMVLSGAINKAIVAAINQAGGVAVGISGKDGNIMTAHKLDQKGVDLGFVGEPDAVNTSVIDALIDARIIPVIAPVASEANHKDPKTIPNTLNVNADSAAGAIAAGLGATRMLLLTDVAGILDKQGKLIPQVTITEAKKLIKDKTVSDGMIPKVNTCIAAVENGAEAAVILDGRSPHATLIELFTEHGIGTIITRN